ncbi:MAG: phosphatase PAP2 family protein [Mycobacteriales bacterium]
MHSEGAPRGQTRRAQLREYLGVRRPPCWWQEVLFVLASYWVYSAIRNGVPTHEQLALARARELDRFQHVLGIAVERSVNHAVAAVDWLAQVSNYWYATAHFIVTIGVLVWVYRRHPLQYRSLRSGLYVANIVALFGYWLYPLAPPRMLPGYVDTVVAFHTWGSWGSSGVASHSNQFAAMPSMHVAWSVWCAIALAGLAARQWVRLLGLAYPIVTLFVIVATANHFVLDAVGGVAALALGFAVQRVASGLPAIDPALRVPAPA